jgi:hypothetical protein
LAALTIVVGVARVYLGYRSVDQVFAGVALGSVFAAVWFLGAIKTLHRAVAFRNLFSPLLTLRDAWEEGYVHSNVTDASKKSR